MSRRVAIYCRGKAVQANRAAEGALRDVASQEGWTVAGTFVDGVGPSKPEYERLWRAIAAHDVDIVAVPSFAAIADGVSRVLAEVLRLRDAAGCFLTAIAGMAFDVDPHNHTLPRTPTTTFFTVS